MKIKIGTTLIVVRLNTMNDPIRTVLEDKYYNPIMVEELVIASEPYVYEKESCFDVIGDSGTLNKGLTDGTRRTLFHDLGVVPEAEKPLMECGGITKSFTDPVLAEKYVEELMKQKNQKNLYSRVLNIFGLKWNDEQIESFITQNNLNEKFKFHFKYK